MVDQYVRIGVIESRIYKLKDPATFNLQNLPPTSDVINQRTFSVMK